ncbi:MAG: bifunctional glycosyltransferase family 2/GtrA family protein [bacterium]|nr:bifunctional glycosyltransferase family 2/GtrA family protein [bacterium]
MSEKPQQAVILIPSLEPDGRLPAYVDQLLERGFAHVVIVDDGSSESYQPIFTDLARKTGCTVLHHEVNRGKGSALKTGLHWIEENLPDCSGVITADADGQHTVEDCWKLAETLAGGRRALYLGSRDFNQADVPPKSRFGNKITSAVFRLFYGKYLPDTQTGLRAFRREELPFMQRVEGERFEYEMNVLIACAMQKLDMIPITIRTVYENENSGTHFHPIRDSYRIYKVILGNFIRFMGASIASFVLDQGLFALLRYVLLIGLGFNDDILRWVSTLLARCVSAPFNFLLNRNMVFRSKSAVSRSGLRYILLSVAIVCMSALLINVLSWLGMPKFLDSLSKLLVDTLLYFVSYRVQRNWVFDKTQEDAAA